MSVVFFFDSIKTMQIKEGVNGDFSFCYWHLTEKQPKSFQLIVDNSEVIELVFMFAADDTEPNLYEIPSVLCGVLSFWAQ